MPPIPLPAVPMLGDTTSQPIEEFDRVTRHPGFGLTVQEVIQIYRTAEFGWPMDQCDMFRDVVENDGHLRSVTEGRNLAVAGKPWQIMAGGPNAVDKVAADTLEGSLRNTNFSSMIAHVLNTRYDGFSGSEIDWRLIDSDVIPVWFVNVPCRRFRFEELDRPRLITRNDFNGQPLKPGHWVFGRNSTSGVTGRSGLLRTALWFSLFKRWSWRDWVIYAEKFGIPLVIGKWGDSAGEEEKATLEDAVTDIGEAGQAVMSKDTEIEIHEAAQGAASNNLHAGIVREANNEMSKLITGSTLTVEQGGPGSFALGQVHADRSFDLIIADAEFMKQRFREDIARPFLHFNGFVGAALPKLVIHVAPTTDPLTRSKVIETLHRMGLPLDMEQLRQEFQLRAPPSDERTLPVLAPEPAPEQIPAGAE